MNQLLKILFFVLTTFTFCFAKAQCGNNIVSTFPTTVNGNKIDQTYTGDVSIYTGTYSSCGVTAGPTHLGTDFSFTQTLTFSCPVNNIVYALTAASCWGNITGISDSCETFNFTVNTGVLSCAQNNPNNTCFFIQSGNTFIANSTTIGSNAYITLTSTMPYTSLTVSGDGGSGGSLMGLCSASIISEPFNLLHNPPITTCAGNPVSIVGDSANMAYGGVYHWSVLNGDSSSLKASDTLNSVTVSPKLTTTYVLQKQQCGIYSYDTLIVRVPISVRANAGKDTTICIGDIAVIGINNCSWCSYNWQPIQSQQPIIKVYPLATTTYTLALKDSCNTTTSLVSVIVDYCQSPVIIIPNIFTPNGDDINEAWQPIIQNPLSIINYQCTIYDRWGIKVFETTNYASGFDGHSTSGISCSEGTYYYVISYTDGKTNEKKGLKGFLELVR